MEVDTSKECTLHVPTYRNDLKEFRDNDAKQVNC